MADLSYPSPAEVQLRLGPHEDAILRVVRRLGWWRHASFEGQMPGDTEVSAVILTADRSSDSLIREILHRSFQLVFPEEGGVGTSSVSGPGVRSLRRGR